MSVGLGSYRKARANPFSGSSASLGSLCSRIRASHPNAPPSTGSAGLIQMIQLFARHSWVAAVFSVIATVGWAVQGLGNAFYYRQVRRALVRGAFTSLMPQRRSGRTAKPPATPWTRQASWSRARVDAQLTLSAGQGRVRHARRQGVLVSRLSATKDRDTGGPPSVGLLSSCS
jgi:hypothetical protein